MFGLTVAAWHPRRREWQPWDALPGLTRSAAGRRWLIAARLRVYTREDFLDRWRQWLADAMGFSAIPRPGDEPVGETGPHTSAPALRAFLALAGVSQAAFASAVGASKSEVSKRLGGALGWSQVWADRVRKCLDGQPEWRERVSKNSR